MIFALHRNKAHVSAGDAAVRVTTTAAEMERSVRALLRTDDRLPADDDDDADADAPAMLVGAIDFAGGVLLLKPRRVVRDGRGSPFAPGSATHAPGPSAAVADPDDAATGPSPTRAAVTAMPPPAIYADMVRAAIAAIADGRIEKVVLARSLVVDAGRPVDPLVVADRLAEDPAVTTFFLDLSDGAPRHFVGATPELLVSRTGRTVASRPLAGSAARSADGGRDRAAATALLRSDKDRREHRLVVEAILDTLAPLCRRLDVPDEPALHRTATMWHLGTAITGELKPDAPSAAGLAALLHPTPAVGGHPRDAAVDLIRHLEPVARGFYGGAVGWVDAAGDGEWHVALRCAEIAGSGLTLHAGAGIVAGSQPEAELAETAAKFRAMLGALDLRDAIDDASRPEGRVA